MTTEWKIAVAAPDSADAVAVLRRYFADISSRYYRRPATDADVDAAMAEEPSGNLVPPEGLFLIGHLDGLPRGCVGIRVLSAEITELTRMFVDAGARGHGGGDALLAAAEEAARVLGARTMRLDTRTDLVEARRLYARHGYVEIPAYSDGRYAQHWFEKHLT
ncbi:Acetyltransferase (GNAT) family protein [Amycolatopsis marina]|uniref:Acetyltransferase (GNAT) family protein n=1 Tax=Amycolatopsis marina TaxID=490629 RepID=A0A1I0YQR5_9PSEU|nr:GNAT family N-acetyltransferase [Amycolatopsis marina]SFB14800.1 Acetyltransferase (GNAT) family protein [Amycolatopsis marina]